MRTGAFFLDKNFEYNYHESRNPGFELPEYAGMDSRIRGNDKLILSLLLQLDNQILDLFFGFFFIAGGVTDVLFIDGAVRH